MKPAPLIKIYDPRKAVPIVLTKSFNFLPMKAPTAIPTTRKARAAHSFLSPATLPRSLNPNPPPIPAIIAIAHALVNLYERKAAPNPNPKATIKSTILIHPAVVGPKKRF
jgi:hypothetical protein